MSHRGLCPSPAPRRPGGASRALMALGALLLLGCPSPRRAEPAPPLSPEAPASQEVPMVPSTAPRLAPDASALKEGATRGWTPEARAALEGLIQARGRGAPGYDPARPPVAVFDWDNTVIRHDIGEAVLLEALTSGWLLRPEPLAPPGWLRPEAEAALVAACPEGVAPGAPFGDAMTPACAEAFFRAYGDGFTEDPPGDMLHRPYAWAALLLAGRDPDAVRAFAARVAADQLAQPIGRRVSVGALDAPGWMRVNPPMADLIAVLGAQGFEVWIVSASAQPLVEAMGAWVGIPPERVIGARLRVGAEGRMEAALQQAPGPCPEGEVMTWRAGKACYIRAVIGREPALVAGDSVTDLEMLEIATELRLVLDRGKEPLMTRARANEDGRWVVQPLFYP